MEKSRFWVILLIFSILYLASTGCAQTVEAWTDKRVSDIRSQVAAISRGIPKFTKTSTNVEGLTLEGAEVTYYRSGKEPRRIDLQMFGETFTASGEFYYENGTLIFAIYRHGSYDSQIGSAPKVVNAEERRFYFAADGRLIRLLIGKSELRPDDAKYLELKNEIVRISHKLLGN